MCWSFFLQDGGTICTQIGLCGSTRTSYTRTSRLNALPPKLDLAKTPVSADACDVCKAVVGYIKPFVDSQATEDEIKQAVEQVCVLINVTGVSKACYSAIQCAHYCELFCVC